MTCVRCQPTASLILTYEVIDKDETTAAALETHRSRERVCFTLFGIAQAVFAKCGRIAFCGQPLVPAMATSCLRKTASETFDR